MSQIDLEEMSKSEQKDLRSPHQNWSSTNSLHSSNQIKNSRCSSTTSAHSNQPIGSRCGSVHSIHLQQPDAISRHSSIASIKQRDDVRKPSISSTASKTSVPTAVSLHGDQVHVDIVDLKSQNAMEQAENLDKLPDEELTNHNKSLFSKVKNWSGLNGKKEQKDDKPSRYEEFYVKHRKMIRWNIYGLLFAGFLAFLISGLVLNFEKTLPLLIITLVVIGYLIYAYVRDTYGSAIYTAVFQPVLDIINQNWRYLKWFVYLGIVTFIVLWIALDTARKPERLISCAGLVMFVIISYAFSVNRYKVYWRQVLWGIGLQFILGLLILRTQAGYDVFSFIGSQVETFLSYTKAGSIFVFGDKYVDHYFAFAVLPIVIFFSAAIAVLYYAGVMKWIITRIAWLMQITMKTSATESLSAAGNIFIGQTESPLLVRPFIQYMTVSELHAVMTGGMATIAGSVLGAFIAFGVSATHLITASVMSAPAALAISKLMYPEVEKDVDNIDGDLNVDMADSTDRGAVEAASSGASAAIPLVANIAANIIAFLSALSFLNAVLGWLGAMVNFPQLSFELICSYVFMPFAFMMGVEWKDCHMVAELIGIKTFLNEFFAYIRLSVLIKNRKNCIPPFMSLRSEVIATYACCGFSNIGSIGIMLGGLTPMAPSRRSDLARIAVRCLIAATIACFMTATLAGILYQIPADEFMRMENCTNYLLNATTAPVTMSSGI